MHVHDEDRPARVLRLREGEQVAEVEAGIVVRAGEIGARVVVRHSCSSLSPNPASSQCWPKIQELRQPRLGDASGSPGHLIMPLFTGVRGIRILGSSYPR